MSWAGMYAGSTPALNTHHVSKGHRHLAEGHAGADVAHCVEQGDLR